MQAIREWLDLNPGKRDALLNRNASYVFFKLLDGPGPIGAFGVPLTAGRSLAVDPSYVPLGAVLWIDLEAPPAAGEAGSGRIQRLATAQDTGGAIKGVIRGDLFWGHGERAGALAGGMKSKGRIYLLLPREVDPIRSDDDSTKDRWGKD